MTGAGPAPKHPGSIFVGRERELQELRGSLAELANGRGRFFMLTGEAGVGKTRLADELAAQAAHHGAQVLWGRCWDGAGAPAYWPWVQIIRTLVRAQEPERLAAQLGAGASDIAQFVPEVRERLPQLPVTPPLDNDEARFRLFDSATAFLRNVAAGQPAVLIFDDLHAADMPSLLLLRFVAHELRGTPLVILALYREAEVRRTAGLAEIFGELAREGSRMSLSSFTEAEIARLAAHVLFAGEPPAASFPVAAIRRVTGGNLFFLVEVMRWLAAADAPACANGALLEPFAIPDHVCESVRWRLRSVPGETSQQQGDREADALRTSVLSPSTVPLPRVGAGRAGAESPKRASHRLAYELGHAMAQQRDLEQLLSFATARCREIVGAEGVAVLLLDRERNELYFPYVAEERPVVAARLRQIRFPADRGLAGAALHRGATLRSDDVSSDPLFFAGVDQLTGRTTRALLCAPLMTAHGAVGVLEAVNPCTGAGFSDDDLSLLDAVAQTMAEAIERLRAAGARSQVRAANVFRKEGDYWVIGYEGGEAFRLKESKGLAYIAHLLRQPGQEFHAIDVIRAHASGRADDSPEVMPRRRDASDATSTRTSLGDAGELLDAQARATYRRHLDDLRAELDAARACNDPGRVGRAQHEIEFLTRELARAVGLGGRERRAGSHAERARVNVTRAISLALGKIAAQRQDLGQHFARTVKTGTFCGYVPDPRVPITWET